MALSGSDAAHRILVNCILTVNSAYPCPVRHPQEGDQPDVLHWQHEKTELFGEDRRLSRPHLCVASDDPAGVPIG